MDDTTKLLLQQMAALVEEVRSLRAGAAAAPRPSKGLATLLDLYLAAIQVSPGSKATIGATLRPAVRHFLERPADECLRADWIHWRDNVRAKERTVRKGPPQAYTLNLEIKRWRSVYRWGNAEGHCSTNPLETVKMLRAKSHRHTRPEESDLQRLLGYCSPMLAAFVLIAARTGMRAAEIRNLAWREIDMRRARIVIPWQRTKTRKERTVPLTADVIEALTRIKPEVGGKYVLENAETREPYGRTSIWMWFRDAIDRAKLEAADGDGRVVAHDLRHQFLSWASGVVPLPVAIAISGHSDLRSASRYIQVTNEQMEDARADLDAAVRSNSVRDSEQRQESTEIPPKDEKSR